MNDSITSAMAGSRFGLHWSQGTSSRTFQRRRRSAVSKKSRYIPHRAASSSGTEVGSGSLMGRASGGWGQGGREYLLGLWKCRAGETRNPKRAERGKNPKRE